MQLLRNALMLAGAFAASYPLAMMLHEMGHAVAVWLTGGTVREIIVHPFSWSYTWYGGPSEYPRFTTWAGAVFGVTCGALLFWIASFSRNPWLLLAAVAALCTFVVNGLYLGIDAALQGGGDGTSLARLGTPVWVLVLLSLALLSLGAAGGCLLMPRLGVTNAPAVLRLAVLAGGVGPYLLSMWIYHRTFNPDELMLWTVYVVAGFMFLALLAWFSTVWDSWCPTIDPQAGSPATWSTSIAMLALGVGIVTALLARA